MRPIIAKLPKTPAEIEALAAQLFTGHVAFLTEGYALCAGSRCWSSRRGMTARLVYRQRDIAAAGIATVIIIVKGIPNANA